MSLTALTDKALAEHHLVYSDINCNITRILCTMTGHELPLTLDAVNAYLRTTKYINALAVKRAVEEHKEYIAVVDHRFFQCTLTSKPIARNADSIQRYFSGKKFARALAKHELGEEMTADDEMPDFAKSDGESEEEEKDVKEEEEKPVGKKRKTVVENGVNGSSKRARR